VRGKIVEDADVEILIPVIFFSVMVVMAGVAISFGIRQSKRARENLQRLAEELGLQAVLPPKRRYLPSGLGSVEGNFRGRFVRIYSYSTGSGKNRTQWSAVEVHAENSGGLSVSISGENIFTRAGRAFGLQDVAIGDEAFDRMFFVRSNQPDYMRMALIPEVRARFIACRDAGARGSVKVDGGVVKYAETGSLANTKIIARIPRVLELVCDAADIVETFRS